ncbi:MAG: alpha/beta hydrolase [Spirochaetales bacterium]|nr:alpha/beta hydrolase [Spirochaetales bacterium]
MKKTGFVLIPGGGMGSWIWEPLVPRLHLPVLAPDKRSEEEDPVRLFKTVSVLDCARYLCRLIDDAGFTSVILVGHSGSGILLPDIIRIIPDKIIHTVYISASIPGEGESALDMLPFFPRILNHIGFLMMGVRKVTETSPNEKMTRKYFCNDCNEETVRFFLEHGVRTEPRALAYNKVSRKNVPEVSATFIRLLKDKCASLALQDRMIRNLGHCNVVDIDAGHMVMLSQPDELARRLNGLIPSSFPHSV